MGGRVIDVKAGTARDAHALGPPLPPGGKKKPAAEQGKKDSIFCISKALTRQR